MSTEDIALRSINTYGSHGRAVGFCVAGRVTVNEPEFAVVTTTPGSDVRMRAGTGSGPNARIVLPDDWDGSYAETRWFGGTVVRVHPRGRRWSVWRWHDGRAWLPDWYVNLESPWERSETGFDTQDWTLDIVARETDAGWTVQYKDVDELSFLESAGHWSAEQTIEIRTAGEEALRVASAQSWPFDTDWDEWLPTDLSPSYLPPGWSLVIC